VLNVLGKHNLSSIEINDFPTHTLGYGNFIIGSREFVDSLNMFAEACNNNKKIEKISKKNSNKK